MNYGRTSGGLLYIYVQKSLAVIEVLLKKAAYFCTCYTRTGENNGQGCSWIASYSSVRLHNYEGHKACCTVSRQGVHLGFFGNTAKIRTALLMQRRSRKNYILFYMREFLLFAKYGLEHSGQRLAL